MNTGMADSCIVVCSDKRIRKKHIWIGNLHPQANLFIKPDVLLRNIAVVNRRDGTFRIDVV